MVRTVYEHQPSCPCRRYVILLFQIFNIAHSKNQNIPRSYGKNSLWTSAIVSMSAVCHFERRLPPAEAPQWELRTQKLKSHLTRTQSLNVLPFKPGVGLYIAIHATRTPRDFFLACFYPSGPFTCIFSKISPDFILCWLWLTLVPVQARRIK